MTIADRATGLLRLLEPERAHRLALRAAGASRSRRALSRRPTTESRCGCSGSNFPTRSGLAAGFDKDAEVPDAMLGLGFGFVEVGTRDAAAAGRAIRSRDSSGSPPTARSSTASASTTRATRRRSTGSTGAQGGPGIVGVNIGANRDSEDRLFDYYAGVRLFAPIASYLTINVSSPNTPGLRELQSGEALDRAAAADRARRAPQRRRNAGDARRCFSRSRRISTTGGSPT